jgi:flagellar motor switch protein FliG
MSSFVLRSSKDGGFRQLLLRVETLPALERDRLLADLEKQDPSGLALIKTKSLSLERVLAWDIEFLGRVFGELHPFTIACLITAKPEMSAHIFQALSPHMKARVSETLASRKPSEAEIEGAHIRLFTCIREMEREGELQLDRIDPVRAAPEACKAA